MINQQDIYSIQQLTDGDYFVIAHLFDRVLVGKARDYRKQLQEAVREDAVLEAHFFNEELEKIVTRIDGQLIWYKPLFHKDVPVEQVITRTYMLEENFKWQSGYDYLEAKEYITYDEDHLAYVAKTILSKLKKKGNCK